MSNIHIDTLINMLKESIGIEAAEHVCHNAIREAGFPHKTLYSQEELNKICDVLKSKGGVIKIVATLILSDIHSAVYYEKELIREKQEKEDLQRMNEVLQEKVQIWAKDIANIHANIIHTAKMAAIGQLGAGVAHELNNPLGGILGYAQFMLEKLRSPESGQERCKNCIRYLEIIEREAARCKKIVANLLQFSRKSILTNPEPVDINASIKEVLTLIGHQMGLKNVQITFDPDPNLAKIQGDANELQQVFTNIILNAQQAMPGGGELKISSSRDTKSKVNPVRDDGFSRQTISNGVKIEFTDTGCGIAKENLTKIFEPFFTTKSKNKGTGLGLWVCYQIIQKHNGEIKVNSYLEKGTTFTIILPAI